MNPPPSASSAKPGSTPRPAGTDDNAAALPTIPTARPDFGPPVFAWDLQTPYFPSFGAVAIRNDHNRPQVRMQIWQFYRWGYHSSPRTRRLATLELNTLFSLWRGEIRYYLGLRRAAIAMIPFHQFTMHQRNLVLGHCFCIDVNRRNKSKASAYAIWSIVIATIPRYVV
jgi:hypothetical protein